MSTKTDILQIKYEVTGDGQVLRSFSAVHEKLTEEDKALQKNRQGLRDLQDELDKTGKRKREFADQLSKLNAAYDAGVISSGNLRKETIAATADYVRGTTAYKVGMVGAAAAVTALSAATAIYIRNTIESEKVQAQLEARIVDTGAAAGQTLGSLNAMADQIDRLTNFDDEAIGGVQATLLTFKNIRGDEFRSAVDAVLDLSQAMGMDLQSASVMVGKALQDPIEGVTALRRAGVQLNEAQEATIKKLVETGDVAGAQGMILQELDSQMGTSAEAARNTLGGALQQLQDDFNNLLEGDAGDNGMVAARAAIESLIDTLNDPDVQTGVGVIVGGVAQIIEIIAKAIPYVTDFGDKLGGTLFAASSYASAIKEIGGIRLQLGKEQLKRAPWEAPSERENELRAREAAIEARYERDRRMVMADTKGSVWNAVAPAVENVAQGLPYLRAGGGRATPYAANDGGRWMMLPGGQSASAPAGTTQGGGGGGGSGRSGASRRNAEMARAAREAERARDRIAAAMASMADAQDDWAQGLKADTNPIAKEYADRLDKIGDMAEKARKAGVPDAEVEKFTAAMKSLASQYRDADIAEFQREFTLETEDMAAAMAGPAVEAALEYGRAVAELKDQLSKGLITHDQLASRVDALAQKQTQAAREMLASIDEEIALLGMSAEQQETYNALKYAGVDATTAEGQAITANIAQLQKLREVRGLAEGVGAAFMDMAESIDDSTKDSKEVLNDFLRDVLRMVLQFFAQKAIEKFATWLVGAFAGMGGGTTSAGTTGPTVGPYQAAGGVWSNGVQQFAAGGVVTAPTYFRHAGGMGLMGEAGSEAIMPLGRGADGKLGVRMVGGASGGVSIALSTQVNVDNSGGKSKDNQGQAEAFSRQLQAEMEGAAMRVITREQRQGGQLWRMQHG